MSVYRYSTQRSLRYSAKQQLEQVLIHQKRVGEQRQKFRFRDAREWKFHEGPIQ